MDKDKQIEIYEFINKYGVESKPNRLDTLYFLKNLIISLNVESDLNEVRYQSKPNVNINEYIETFLKLDAEVEKAEEYLYLIKSEIKEEKKLYRKQKIRTFLKK